MRTIALPLRPVAVIAASATLLALLGLVAPLRADAATAPSLSVSQAATRTEPAPLDGATLSRSSYVFLSAPDGAQQVEFLLDGRSVQVEGSAPWDLLGGPASSPIPLDVSRLATGNHTVIARVTTSTGRAEVRGAFSVVRQSQPAAVLNVSLKADRSSASSLSGASLSTASYVFLAASGATTPVVFSLDGRRVREEGSAPYDLSGGTVSTANALDVSRLTAGTHTVTASWADATGPRHLSATFTKVADVVASPTPIATPAPSPTTPPTSDPSPVPTARFNPLTFDWSRVGAAPGTSFQEYTLGSITRSGMVHTSQRTPVARLSVSGVDSGFRNSFIRGALKPTDGARALVENSTIMSEVSSGVSGSSMVVRNSYVSSLTNDGLNPVGSTKELPSLIEGNRIERTQPRYGDSHQDGIQMWSGSHVTVRRNWISGYSTSAMLLKTDQGPISHITIEENYLANPDGFVVLYARDSNFGKPEYVTVRNNTFGKGSPISAEPDTVYVRTEQERASAVASGVRGAATWIVWSGNVDVNGREIAPPKGWRS